MERTKNKVHNDVKWKRRGHEEARKKKRRSGRVETKMEELGQVVRRMRGRKKGRPIENNSTGGDMRVYRRKSERRRCI